jgi:hypothetical protein
MKRSGQNGDEFEEGQRLTMAHQADGYSCAIMVWDLICELTLRATPWKAPETHLRCVEYALLLCISTRTLSEDQLGLQTGALLEMKAGLRNDQMAVDGDVALREEARLRMPRGSAVLEAIDGAQLLDSDDDSTRGPAGRKSPWPHADSKRSSGRLLAEERVVLLGGVSEEMRPYLDDKRTRRPSREDMRTQNLGGHAESIQHNAPGTSLPAVSEGRDCSPLPGTSSNVTPRPRENKNNAHAPRAYNYVMHLYSRSDDKHATQPVDHEDLLQCSGMEDVEYVLRPAQKDESPSDDHSVLVSSRDDILTSSPSLATLELPSDWEERLSLAFEASSAGHYIPSEDFVIDGVDVRASSPRSSSGRSSHSAASRKSLASQLSASLKRGVSKVLGKRRARSGSPSNSESHPQPIAKRSALPLQEAIALFKPSGLKKKTQLDFL